jgi:putative addiction module CopG family antidote
MNVTLSPETEKFIHSQIQAGLFASPDQLLEEAVREMMAEDTNEEDLDDETIAAINEGQAQIDRGEGMDRATFLSELRKRTGLNLQ